MVVRKLLRLSWRERLVLAQATALVGGLRLGLAVLPFPRVLGLVEWAGDRPGRRRDEAHVERWVWAVTAAGRRILPGRACLPQALVIHAVLRRAGRPAELRVGVLPETSSELVAHAWVESGGRVVIGGEDAERTYVPLPPLELRRGRADR